MEYEEKVEKVIETLKKYLEEKAKFNRSECFAISAILFYGYEEEMKYLATNQEEEDDDG